MPTIKDNQFTSTFTKAFQAVDSITQNLMQSDYIQECGSFAVEKLQEYRMDMACDIAKAFGIILPEPNEQEYEETYTQIMKIAEATAQPKG